MKSPIALLTAAALAALLAACGQTGPLYMPKPPAKPAAAVTPAPAPATSGKTLSTLPAPVPAQ